MIEMVHPRGDHPEPAENGQDRLTCIRNAYTLAGTPEQGSEIDRLMIDNFLTTLAEVAMSIASRKLQDEHNKGGE
jgi:hypothetical protein